MRVVFRLPEELRPVLAEPMGRVFSGEEAAGSGFRALVDGAPMVVTVGDRVTETLGKMGRPPEVQVVDGVERRSRRKLPKVEYSRLIKVANPPGTLTLQAIDGMREAFGGEKPVRVEVDGEEDLLAMVAITMAPISAIVFYGQPKVGVVAVKATATAKARSRALLAKMGIERLQ